MKKIALTFLTVFLSLQIHPKLPAQTNEFTMGLYGDTNSSVDLSLMSNGGVNYLFGSKYVQNWSSWYRDLIKYADSSDIYIIPNVRFESVDWCPDDTIISYGIDPDPNCEHGYEFNQLKTAVAELLKEQQKLINDNVIAEERIGGWSIADEPYARSVDPNKTNTPSNELEKYADSLKAFLGNVKFTIGTTHYNLDYPYKTLHLSEGATIKNDLNPNPEELYILQDYSEYAESFDELTIFYYNYTINKDHTNLSVFGSNWDPTSSNPSIEEGSLRALSLIKQKANFDLASYLNKKVNIALVLGEEKPSKNPDGSNNYHTYEEEYLASHEMTHSAIRKSYDLGFDGIFFYDWNGGPETRDDAISNWTTGENYSEVLSTEIYDRDWLVTSFSNSSGSHNRTYLSNRGSGQNPAAGYNEETGTSTVTHLATADLWGETNSDFTYVINTNNNRKSIADGDDELVWVTEDRDFWISEDNHVNSAFGDVWDSDQHLSSGWEITALTIGDFDGDGDHETVIAAYNSSTNKSGIYISYEGKDLNQVEIGTTSVGTKVSALAAGDFDGSGRDKLVTATWNSSASDMIIYLSDIAKQESPIKSGNELTINLSSTMYVSNFAVGDFDGDFEEALATVFRNVSGSYFHLTISEPKLGGANGNPGWGPNIVWYSPSSYDQITALTAGDFKNERQDYLITGFWNPNTNISNIYESRPRYESDCIKDSTSQTETGSADECNPQDSSDPNTTHIYVNGTYWHPTAMAAGSFRESGTGIGTPKIIAEEPTSISEIPENLSLNQNYPNPFNPTTSISFSLNEQGLTSLTVYNLLGQKVATLVDEVQQAGNYTVNFNASSLSSGIYIYELKFGNSVLRQKMTLIK